MQPCAAASLTSWDCAPLLGQLALAESMPYVPHVFGGKERAQLHLLPSIEVPSDHTPVVGDFFFKDVSKAALREGDRSVAIRVDRDQINTHVTVTLFLLARNHDRFSFSA